MSIYLRVKRRNQTFFMLCEAGEPLSELKKRISVYTNMPIFDIRFHEYFTEEKKQAKIEELKRELKAKEMTQKPKKKKKGDDTLSITNTQTTDDITDPNSFLLIPLDETKTIKEHGFDNDDIILFVYRIDEDEWEELEAEGYLKVEEKIQEQGGEDNNNTNNNNTISSSSSSSQEQQQETKSS